MGPECRRILYFWLVHLLGGGHEAFGHTVNGKGYKVLNHVRVIQGDGINPNSIRAILERITSAGYATDNLAFGMAARCCSAWTATRRSSHSSAPPRASMANGSTSTRTR